LYFLRTLHGQHIILSIPLAGAGSGSIETILLSTILYIRLRAKVRTDIGMQRLERWRNRARGVIVPALPVGGEIGNVSEPEMVDEASITALFYPVNEQGETLRVPEGVKEQSTPVLEIGETPVEEVHLPVPTTEEAAGETAATAVNIPDEGAETVDTPPYMQAVETGVVETPENVQAVEVEAKGEKSLLPDTPAKQKTVPTQRQPKGQHSAAKRKTPGNKPSQKRKNNR